MQIRNRNHQFNPSDGAKCSPQGSVTNKVNEGGKMTSEAKICNSIIYHLKICEKVPDTKKHATQYMQVNWTPPPEVSCPKNNSVTVPYVYENLKSSYTHKAKRDIKIHTVSTLY